MRSGDGLGKTTSRAVVPSALAALVPNRARPCPTPSEPPPTCLVGTLLEARRVQTRGRNGGGFQPDGRVMPGTLRPLRNDSRRTSGDGESNGPRCCRSGPKEPNEQPVILGPNRCVPSRIDFVPILLRRACTGAGCGRLLESPHLRRMPNAFDRIHEGSRAHREVLLLHGPA